MFGFFEKVYLPARQTKEGGFAARKKSRTDKQQQHQGDMADILVDLSHYPLLP
jgi:hypothetical protein